MRTIVLTSAISAIAFAAADAAKGAAAAVPESATGSKPLVALLDQDKVEAIGKAMRSRQLFPTYAEAQEALLKAAANTENFYGLPIAIVGHDDETNAVDESVYAGCNAALAYVGAREQEAGKATRTTGIKAIVIFPIPTVETFLAGGEAAESWIAKIVEKEAAHVAFRGYRDASTDSELVENTKSAPKSVEEYVTASNREGNGLDTETFDALWSALRTAIKNDQPALYKLLPTKPEVIKAIRSKAYAESEPELAQLEAHDIFVKLAGYIIDGAKNNVNKDGTANPLDPAAVESWLAGRDTLVIEKAKPAAKDFSVLGALDF